MRYSRAFYPGWDDAYAGELRAMFALDPAAKIKTLSKGQKARAGLVVALALPEWFLGKTIRDFDASAEMWRFFERHPKTDILVQPKRSTRR